MTSKNTSTNAAAEPQKVLTLEDICPLKRVSENSGGGEIVAYDTTEIEAGLWQGGSIGGTSLPPPHINAIVNLRKTPDIYLAMPESLKAVLWFPLEDGSFPGVPWLDAVVRTVASLRAVDWNVLVHCAAGISRSSLVTAGYLMATYGYRRDQALDILMKKRPCIDPAPEFMKGLSDYELILRGS
jgi:hypothetical protein